MTLFTHDMFDPRTSVVHANTPRLSGLGQDTAIGRLEL